MDQRVRKGLIRWVFFVLLFFLVGGIDRPTSLSPTIKCLTPNTPSEQLQTGQTGVSPQATYECFCQQYAKGLLDLQQFMQAVAAGLPEYFEPQPSTIMDKLRRRKPRQELFPTALFQLWVITARCYINAAGSVLRMEEAIRINSARAVGLNHAGRLFVRP